MNILKNILDSMTLKIIAAISSIIGLIVNVLQLTGFLKWNYLIGPIIIFIGLLLLVVGMVLQNKELMELKQKYEEKTRDAEELSIKNEEMEKVYNGLLEIAYNGLKFTSNTVTINFDKSKKLYSFQFEKHFTMITDVIPEYYSAQFYANKYITDKDKAKAFYEQNPMSFDSLQVGACVSYKVPNAESFTREINLDIINISDNTNYIIFKILYKELESDNKIDMIKGTEVKLKYWYTVPVTYWGSYLNRTISYFGEEAKVILKYNLKSDLNFKVLRLKNGEPRILEKDKYHVETHRDDGKKVVTITFDRCEHKQQRFRITWDANSYFRQNDLNTKDGIDQLGLTNK